jgi:5-methyltetrahydrofolate--homocysteine methyltransferase
MEIRSKGKEFVMEILEEVSSALINGDHIKIVALIKKALGMGIPYEEIYRKGLIKGMDFVGEKFKNNEMWMPEVMMSARAMNACLEILEPLMKNNTTLNVGKFVVGTVEGDLHDVGKNMVAMMMKGAGFEVIDLGINVPAQRFIEALRKEKAQIMGMSSLLTTTMPKMASIIKEIESAGLRSQIKIMVGGAPVSQAFADDIGADGYAPDSAQGVEKARELIGLK